MSIGFPLLARAVWQFRKQRKSVRRSAVGQAEILANHSGTETPKDHVADNATFCRCGFRSGRKRLLLQRHWFGSAAPCAKLVVQIHRSGRILIWTVAAHCRGSGAGALFAISTARSKIFHVIRASKSLS